MNLLRRAIFLTENLNKGGNNYFTLHQNPNIAKDSLVPIMSTDRELIPSNGSKLGHSFSSTKSLNVAPLTFP